jgi:EpsI family protein
LNGSAGRRFHTLLSAAVPDGAPSLSVAIASALILWFSWPTIVSLHTSFTESADYTHGHLVFALAAFLIVRELRRAPMEPAPGSFVGATCLLLLLLAVIVGHASTTLIVAQLALPMLWLCAIWALAGLRNARRLALAFAYLYFAIPIWNLLVEPMRRLTVHIVTAWTRAAGLPAFIEGNLIHVPTGTFEVEGGCAGLRYALVAVALAIFSCLLLRRRLMPSVLFTLFALAVALVGNWLRVFITVAAGLAPEGRIAMFVHNNHTLMGWLLFAVLMIPVFYLDRRLPAPNDSVPAQQRVGPRMRELRGAAAYVACAAVAVGIWLNYRISDDGAVPPLQTVTFTPPQLSEWNRTAAWQDARRPIFVGPTSETASWYVSGDVRIGVYVAHYPIQRQGSEVVFAHNLPEGRTGFVSSRRRATNEASGAALPFQELTVSDAEDQRRLVWVGFRVAGKPAADALEAKALQVVGALRGRRDAQAMVLTAVCDDGCENARVALSDFAGAGAEPRYVERFFEAATK